MSPQLLRRAVEALDDFAIETPSWGFADTGTRFGKFFQDAAAIDLNDKLADAGQVNALTGCCPTVAVHVLWDFQPGQDPKAVARLARKHGVKIGSINPNLFQDQCYKWGSFGHNDPAVRRRALQHCLDSVAICKAVGSEYVSLWFADGTNYPGQGDLRARKHWFEESLRALHRKLGPRQTMLVEYKPFEPAFYATDIADWGMAYLHAKKAGPRAKVLVDTGHHYAAQNIEQIVAFLLDEDMLGGFHFNDRRYADDDLTLGSIDPYQVFRIFHEIHSFRRRPRPRAEDRLHDRPVAQREAEDRGDDPDRGHGAGTLRQGRPRQPRRAPAGPGEEQCDRRRAGAEEGVLHRCRAGPGVVAPCEQAARPIRCAEHRRSGYERAAAADRRRRRKELGITQGGSYA
jgi:L-rhamnose isomerase/sugar isomerase